MDVGKLKDIAERDLRKAKKIILEKQAELKAELDQVYQNIKNKVKK